MPRRRSQIGRNTRRANQRHTERLQQTPQEQTQHREENRNRMSQTRENLSQEQRAIQNELHRVRTREARAGAHVTNRITFHRLAFHYESTIDYNSHRDVDIGNMNQVCDYCKAYKYKKEAPGCVALMVK